MLPSRRERPRGQRTAEQRDEVAPLLIELHAIPRDERGPHHKDIELAAISQRVVAVLRTRQLFANAVGSASHSCCGNGNATTSFAFKPIVIPAPANSSSASINRRCSSSSIRPASLCSCSSLVREVRGDRRLVSTDAGGVPWSGFSFRGSRKSKVISLRQQQRREAYLPNTRSAAAITFSSGRATQRFARVTISPA